MTNTDSDTPRDVASTDDDASHGGFRGFIEWLNEKLYSALGPPPIGPYGPIVERVGTAVCPVCSRPMAEHRIERSRADTILHCPVGHAPPEPDLRPLNELGMPRHDSPRHRADS